MVADNALINPRSGGLCFTVSTVGDGVSASYETNERLELTIWESASHGTGNI